VAAEARSVWPIHRLEIIVNGRVVEDAGAAGGASARTREASSGAEVHTIRAACRLPVKQSCWIAARCASRLEKHQIMMGSGHLGAHTSPIYVAVGQKEIFSPSDALYMLTLLEGTITYLDTLGTRVDQGRHDRMISLVQEVQHQLLHRLKVKH
jgi:hypothetical protein